MTYNASGDSPVVCSPLDRMVGPDELRAELQERLRYNYQKVVAKSLGVSAAYLNDYLQGRREPGAKLLRGLGFERVVMYRRVNPNASLSGEPVFSGESRLKR